MSTCICSLFPTYKTFIMKINNVEDIYSLSPIQQGMLFHTLYAPNSSVYFAQSSCRIEGDFNISAFKQAWQQVIERHSVLRTAFIWEGLDEALQVVRQEVDLPWVQHDWRKLSRDEQQDQLEAFLQKDRERGFDLSNAPLMRLILIQMDEKIYQFIWSHHHLLLDGWSTPLVLNEVIAFYEALHHGQNLHLRRSRPYRDYVAWLQQQDLTKAEAFWRKALSGVSAPTSLGVDRTSAKSAREQESYAEERIKLSVATTATLSSFARQHQLTVSTLVQGAWAILLSRYSREQDVIFGATVSGRPATLAGVESMVGLFINTLPVRMQVLPKTDLVSWLQQLQAYQSEMRSYEYSPLVQVQGWSEMPRGVPLFESIVVFENYPIETSLNQQDGNLNFSDARGFEQTNYPLTLVVAPGLELSLRMIYDCQRFDAITIGSMLGHLQNLLKSIIANPQQRLQDLQLLSEGQRQQILVKWNQTKQEYPQQQCIHQLFEAQVEKTPDAVAVVCGKEQLTYSQLNCRANKMAHYLQSLGVGSETLVGVCVERSIGMVVGLLAILKAGAA